MRIINKAVTDKFEDVLKELIIELTGPMSQDQERSVQDTPHRVVKAFIELTNGYDADPEEILERRFNQELDEMVVVKNIDFNSTCEHHLLPFVGRATVGYIPNGVVVGLSKIPRLVDCYANRLQLQERMAVEIADAMEKYLQPLGVGVILEAKHQCMSCRGVKKQNAEMITSVVRGRLKENDSTRAEFMKFVNGGH